jgi:hypothetical protein
MSLNFSMFSHNEQKVKRKKRSEISFEEIQKHFETPIKEAAMNLEISLTQLKRICREMDIPRWPYRKLFSIQNKIDELNLSLDGSDDLTKERIISKINSYKEEMVFIKNHPKSIAKKKTKQDDDDEDSSNSNKRKNDEHDVRDKKRISIESSSSISSLSSSSTGGQSSLEKSLEDLKISNDYNTVRESLKKISITSILNNTNEEVNHKNLILSSIFKRNSYTDN